MPIDFPTSPSPNDVYTFNQKSWIWNGYAWASIGGGVTGSVVGTQGPTGATGPQGATGADGSATIPIASTGSTGVASFDDAYFSVTLTGHVSVKTGIKLGNLIVLGASNIFGMGETGALPALDGSALTGVDAARLQGRTARQVTDGGTF